MKSLILPIYLGLLFVSILLPGVATAQLNKLKKAVDAVIISSKSIDNPSPTEMAMGLKEALEKELTSVWIGSI